MEKLSLLSNYGAKFSWLTKVVSKGSYKNLKARDERVGSACMTERVEWDEGKCAEEVLQALGLESSLTAHAMMEATLSRENSS